MAAGAMAGCLRLEEDGQNGQGVGADGDDTAGEDGPEGAETGDEADSVDLEADEIELVESWTRSGLTETTTADGVLFGAVDSSADEVSTERLERFDDNGEMEWYSEELPDGDSFTLGSHGGVLLGGDLVVAVAHEEGTHQSDDAKLSAYDAESGEQQWVHRTDADREEASVRALASDGAAIYYCVTGVGGTDDDQQPSVRALDLDTGEVLWAEEFDEGFLTGVAVYDDRLYVSASWEIYAFDTASGEIVDEYDFDTGFGGFAPAEDVLYLGHTELLAYDPAIRDLRWEREPNRFNDPDLEYFDGAIYGGTTTGWVFAHDADDGERLWEARTDGSVTELHVTQSDLVWVLNDETTVTAIHAATGELLYEDDIETRQFGVEGQYVVFGETAYEVEV